MGATGTPSLSFVVGSGTIYPSRFVTLGPSDYSVQQSVASGVVIGISQEGGRLAPTDENSATPYAGALGDQIAVYGIGRTCLLTIASTITVGNTLISDANGKGVYAASGNLAAVAMESGVSGDLIKVQLVGGNA